MFYSDPMCQAFRGEAMNTLQRAVVAEFSLEDWHRLGYATDTHNYIRGHRRLLRSLEWQDADYGVCVFDVLTFFANNNPPALRMVIDHPGVRQALERECPQLLADLGIGQKHFAPPAPRQLSAGEVVERAIADADHLMRESGPLSAVDRLHTALHGYVRHLVEELGVHVPPRMPLTRHFKELRTNHPAFRQDEDDNDTSRMLNGLANVVDSLNAMRNDASVAHPNKELLGDEEAVLAVNATRTLFHYVFAKVRAA